MENSKEAKLTDMNTAGCEPDLKLSASTRILVEKANKAHHSHDNAIAAKEYIQAARLREEYEGHQTAVEILRGMLYIVK